MYPQYAQSVTYQPVPQFNPEVRLSPQNVVQEYQGYQEVPQFEPELYHQEYQGTPQNVVQEYQEFPQAVVQEYQEVPQYNFEPEMIPRFAPQNEFVPQLASPRNMIVPPRVPIEYEEVEPVITLSPPKSPKSPRTTRIRTEYDDIELTRATVPRVAEELRVEPIRSPVTRTSPPKVVEVIRPPVVRINPPVRPPVTITSPLRVIEDVEPIVRFNPPVRPPVTITSPHGVVEQIRPQVVRINPPIRPPVVVEQIRPPVVRINPPVRPPVTITSPPVVRINPPVRPPVTITSPPRVIEQIRPPIMYQNPEPAGITLSDLPQDVLIEMLINLPPGRLSALCSTNSSLSKLCNNESFLRDLIARKYKVTVNNIPGQTIKEKYAFISQFDPRYFTDPDFVKINPSYKRDFGLDYTSRKNPNDALNTIISIMVDSDISDGFNVLSSIYIDRAGGGQIAKPGIFNSQVVRLLSGAMMTRSQSFVRQILSILTDRILPLSWGSSWNSYSDSFRYPFILSIEYGMNDITDILRQYYYNYNNDHYFNTEIVDEISSMDSIDILDRFIPYLDVNGNLFRRLMGKGKYELADYVLSKLRNEGRPYIFQHFNLTDEIANGDVSRIKYLMKYITPAQHHINIAINNGFLNIARILQGQPEIEEVIDE